MSRETLDARYIRHAPGSALAADGAPADAGTLMVLDSNISHLVTRGTRQLVEAVVGPVVGFAAAADCWSGLAGVPSGTLAQWDPISGLIPWDRRTAARFGPIAGICDRELVDGTMTLRSVVCHAEFDVHAGATTSQDAYFAMTLSGDPAALAAGNYLGHVSIPLGGTGLRTATATLSAGAPISAGYRTPWPSRVTGSQQTLVIPVWLWFGWRLLGTTSDSTVISLSAYETR